MQNFNLYSLTENGSAAFTKILDALPTILSQSSGTAFPTNNLQTGMPCYRTDLKSLYILRDAATQDWVKVLDLVSAFGNADMLDGKHASELAAAIHTHTKSNITDFPSSLPANGGNASTATKLQTAIKINGVAFDGSADITITAKAVGGNADTVGGKSADQLGGFPVGSERMIGYTELDAGDIPLTGGTYSRTAYADLWAWVQTKPSMLKTESSWQEVYSANGGRGVPFYSSGDGSTTFRVPLKDVWIRGASNTSEVGQYLSAGLPNITGKFKIGNFPLLIIDQNGCFIESEKGAADAHGQDSTGNQNTHVVMDASKSNPIFGKANTVQPQSIIQLWVVRAYGTITNTGSTDVAAIGAGLAILETKTSELETTINNDTGFTIIYPNGGTASNPASVTVNSRYVMTNPFQGYDVITLAEVKYNNNWCDTGWIYADGGFGVKASYLFSGEIVIQTGSRYVTGAPGSVGSGIVGMYNLSSAPCRVKVWKCGRIK